MIKKHPLKLVIKAFFVQEKVLRQAHKSFALFDIFPVVQKNIKTKIDHSYDTKNEISIKRKKA